MKSPFTEHWAVHITDITVRSGADMYTNSARENIVTQGPNYKNTAKILLCTGLRALQCFTLTGQLVLTDQSSEQTLDS